MSNKQPQNITKMAFQLENSSQHAAQTADSYTSIKRLNNQLRVDFAVNVHECEGKRKRGPTRSVYEEAAANFEKEAKERRLKKRKTMAKREGCDIKPRVIFASNKAETRKPIRFIIDTPPSAEISEFGEEEGYTHQYTDADHQNLLMMHAAVSLAQLSKQTGDNATMVTIEAITKAHLATIAAKDEAIQAVNDALAAKEELVKAQAALIMVMQQNSTRP